MQILNLKNFLFKVDCLIGYNFSADISKEHELTKEKLEQLENDGSEQLANSDSTIATLKENVQHLQGELQSTQDTLNQTREKLSDQEHICHQLQETVGAERENQTLLVKELQMKQAAMEATLDETQSRLTEVETSLESSMEHTCSLKASKEALDGDLQVLSQKASQQEKTIIKQGNQICDLEFVVSEKEAEIEQMKSHLDETDDQLSNSQRDYKSELAVKRKEVASLQEELSRLRENYEANEHALQFEREKMNEKEEEIETLKERSNCETRAIRQQLEQVENELKRAQQKQVEDDHRIGDLNSQITLLTSQLDTDRDMYERKEFEIKEHEAHVQEINATLQEEISQLKNSILEKDELISAQKSSVLECHEDALLKAKFTKEIEDGLNKQLLVVQSELCQLEKQLIYKTEIIEHLTLQLEALKISIFDEKSCLLQSLAESEEKLEQVTENSQNEIELLERKLETLKQENQEALVEHEKFNFTLQEDLDKTRESTLLQKKSAEKDLATLKMEKLELETAVADLTGSSDAKETELQKLKQEQAENSHKLHCAFDHIEALQCEIHEQRDALAVTDRESTQVREELEHQIKHQSQQLETLSNKLDAKQQEVEMLLEGKNAVQNELILLKQNIMESNDVGDAIKEELGTKLEHVQEEKERADTRIADLLQLLDSSRKTARRFSVSAECPEE